MTTFFRKKCFMAWSLVKVPMNVVFNPLFTHLFSLSRVTESSPLDVLERWVRSVFCDLFRVTDIKETHLKIQGWCDVSLFTLQSHLQHTYPFLFLLSGSVLTKLPAVSKQQHWIIPFSPLFALDRQGLGPCSSTPLSLCPCSTQHVTLPVGYSAHRCFPSPLRSPTTGLLHLFLACWPVACLLQTKCCVLDVGSF